MNILRIRRDEALPSLVTVVVLSALNALVVWGMNFNLYTRAGKVGYWSIFHKGFKLSGFDQSTYVVLSTGRPMHSHYRHPFFHTIMYPFYMLDRWLMDVTGMNCAIFIVAVLNVVVYLYSVIFMQRILREVIGVDKKDAWLLTAFFFSFAYVMLSAMAPEHFGYTLCLLLVALYLAGKCINDGKMMKTWHTALLFLLATGITTTNCVKIGLAQLFANGRRLFRLPNLLIAYILPAAFILAVYCYQENTVYAKERRYSNNIETKKRAKDSVYAQKALAREEAHKAVEERQLGASGYMEWTDMELSRWKTLTDNFFGESVQLHEDYLLEDVNRKRPVFVPYNHWYNYAVEVLVVVLFAAGIVFGCRQRFLWLMMSWLGFDVLLHFGLGFAITEVYIMAAHWIFIIPLSVAYIIKNINESRRPVIIALRLTVLLVTAYLWYHNASLICSYFIK